MINKIKNINNSHILLILKLFKKEIWAIVFLSSLINLLMLTPTIYMLQIFDRVMISKSEFSLFSISAIVVFFYITQSFSELFRSRILIGVGVKIDEVLSEPIFNAAFKDQLSSLGKNPLQVFSDLTVIRQWLTGAGVYSFFDLPWTPIYMFVMFMLHPLLGYVTIFFMAILAVVAYLNSFYLKDLAYESMEEERELNTFIYAKLKNTEVIEAHGMTPNLMKNWWYKQIPMYVIQSRSKDMEERMNSISRNVRILMQSLALAIGALLAIEDQISMGAMIAASLLIGRATSPIDGIVHGWKNLDSVRDAFYRVESLLARHKLEDKDDVSLIVGDIHLDNVVVRVDGREKPILDGISMDLPAGQIYGVIGPSGAGKSTLGRVLVGAWPDIGGNVFYDGKHLQAKERELFGMQIGYLPQAIELFAGSVAQNIARMGVVDSEKVIAAAQMAGIHNLVLRLEKGYDTQVGPMGSYLSGGQRQRLALARALYGNPKVLVLDEPNANLDEAGESALVSAILALKANGSSIFLITHRPNILNVVDRVIYMNEGRIKVYETRESFFNRANLLKI